MPRRKLIPFGSLDTFQVSLWFFLWDIYSFLIKICQEVICLQIYGAFVHWYSPSISLIASKSLRKKCRLKQIKGINVPMISSVTFWRSHIASPAIFRCMQNHPQCQNSYLQSKTKPIFDLSHSAIQNNREILMVCIYRKQFCMPQRT